MEFSIHEATAQLERLVQMAGNGEEVIIKPSNGSSARLVPVAAGRRRKVRFGSMKDSVQLKEGWDRPMTDEQADAFLEGRD
jgi:antitoxin (DNA-binding transcriptional repressor) of toxin-antitoxin stability system